MRVYTVCRIDVPAEAERKAREEAAARAAKEEAERKAKEAAAEAERKAKEVTFVDPRTELERRSEEERRKAAMDKPAASGALGGVKGVAARSGKNISSYMRALREVEQEERGGAPAPPAPVTVVAPAPAPAPAAPAPAPTPAPAPVAALAAPAPAAASSVVSPRGGEGVGAGFPDPAVTKLPYEELRRRPAHLPSDKLHLYLADEEFRTVFGMSRADFDRMPGWKKDKARQAKGLF